MSDDKTVTDVTEPKVEPKTQKDANEALLAAEAEKKEIIAQRDKLKAKLREIEDKDKKAAEDKAIEEGKLKDVLTNTQAQLADAQKKLETVEAVRVARRQKVLDGIADANLKKFADKMGDAEDIQEFLDTLSTTKITTHNAQRPNGGPPEKKYKDAREYLQEQQGGGLF